MTKEIKLKNTTKKKSGLYFIEKINIKKEDLPQILILFITVIGSIFAFYRFISKDYVFIYGIFILIIFSLVIYFSYINKINGMRGGL